MACPARRMSQTFTDTKFWVLAYISVQASSSTSTPTPSCVGTQDPVGCLDAGLSTLNEKLRVKDARARARAQAARGREPTRARLLLVSHLLCLHHVTIDTTHSLHQVQPEDDSFFFRRICLHGEWCLHMFRARLVSSG
jgi:hypothetical protein